MTHRPQAVLSQYGLKHTKQREALLDLLMHQAAPINAETCYSLLQKAHQAINLSTIYRILDQFTQAHIVEKSYNSLSQGHVYSLVLGHHRHYLLCTKCHQMIPLMECPMHDVIQAVEQTTGFKVQSHGLEIQGLCPQCQDES